MTAILPWTTPIITFHSLCKILEVINDIICVTTHWKMAIHSMKGLEQLNKHFKLLATVLLGKGTSQQYSYWRH